MDWNIASRQSRIPQAELADLHQKAVELLDLLQKNLPDKTGEKAGWNFEKAHSILHKVREIVLWGNSDNTSCQAPEVSTLQYVQTAVRKSARHEEQVKCAVETRRRRKATKASSK